VEDRRRLERLERTRHVLEIEKVDAGPGQAVVPSGGEFASPPGDTQAATRGLSSSS